jgi:hypothetical protein
MTTPRLTARVDKLDGPKTAREVFIEIQAGESREDLARRVEAVRERNRPVMAMPVSCATIEEWAELCAHYGHRVVWERGKK